MSQQRNGPSLGSSGALVHQLGQVQDHAARLAVCHTMAKSGHAPGDIYDVLDALALLPGTEHKRDMIGSISTAPKDALCTPTTSRTAYIPN